MRVCVRCRREVAGRYRGRTLCSSCYNAASKLDLLPDYPRTTWPTAVLVGEALRLRAEHGEPGWHGHLPFTERTGRAPDFGITWAQVADRLGVSRPTLTRALERHRARERATAG